MTSYTISIAPNDDSGATTTVVVDTADGTSRITDVHLHAAAGLTNGRLPDIDFDLLIAAFTSAPQTAVDAGAAPAQIDAAPSDVTDAPTDNDDPTSAVSDPAETPVAAPTTSRSRRRAARSPQTPTTVTEAATPTTTRKRRKTTPRTTPAAPAADTAGSVTVETRGGREYRRTPDDLPEVYRQTGSAVGVAEHYQVPRHTAQGWVRRLTRSAR